MKIKIIEKNWENYNGYFGSVMFEDGIGETDEVTATRLGCQIQIENVEDGEVINPYAPPSIREMPIESVLYERQEEKVEETVEEEKVEETVEEKIYTLEELQSIADEKGIQGIREIATPMDIKGTSINVLIDGILNAQKK